MTGGPFIRPGDLRGVGTEPNAAAGRLAANREAVGYGTVQRDVAQLG